MKQKNSQKGSWLVRVEVTVMKEVVCEDCTEAEAVENPFQYAIEERETDMLDWNVESVEENK